MELPASLNFKEESKEWPHEIAQFLIECAVLSYKDKREVFREIGSVLRIKVAPDKVAEEKIKQDFKEEFRTKKRKCAVLVVRTASDLERWIIAAYDDADRFRTMEVNNSGDELLQELNKEPIDEVRIVELAASRLNRTVGVLEWFEARGKLVDTQAFGIVLKDDIVLAFRGTEGLRDVLSDVTITRSTLMDFDYDRPLTKEIFSAEKGEASGAENTASFRPFHKAIKAHDGFRRCLDSIWSEKYQRRRQLPEDKKSSMTIPDFLSKYSECENNQRRIWLTGHSLGGALATIAAARMVFPGSPYSGAVAGLFTIGSPRALNRPGALELMRRLNNGEKVFRIVQAIDPVPLVPRLRYKHVSGVPAFVTSQGNLVIKGNKYLRQFERLLSWFRAIEDAIGTVLPGQHKGVDAFVNGHSKEGYLLAVQNWNTDNQQSMLGILKQVMAPIKLVLASVAGTTIVGPYWPMIRRFLGLTD